MPPRPPRLPETDLEELPRELADLKSKIDALDNEPDPELSSDARRRRSESAEELDGAYQRVVDSFRRRRRILSLVQEALSQLRLDIKYLMFDLDVTKRERDELRESLEDREF